LPTPPLPTGRPHGSSGPPCSDADRTVDSAPHARAARPDLSIIVVNRNTRGLLEECLESIQALPDEVECELIVVDNGSTDGSVEMVRSRFPRIHLIRNEGNTGYAYPNNQGIAISLGRYVLLLNSDTVVRPFALSRLVEFMDAHPDAGACGPMLRYPDGGLQRSCYSIPSPRTYFACMSTLDRVFPRSRLFGNQNTGFGHDRTVPVEALLGAALLVRREALERVGNLDEQLRIHYNDFDWCLRIHQAGWRIYYVHDAEVVHHSQATTRVENRDLRFQGELVRNLFDYYEKHYGRWGVRWIRLCMLAGWGVRYLLLSVLRLVWPSKADPVEVRYRLGMARAGWTGDPHQFGTERIEIEPPEVSPS
jgi:GT2 family glycosyltransferase